MHDKTLLSHLENFKSILTDKLLTLIIFGMENYFKYDIFILKSTHIKLDCCRYQKSPKKKYAKTYASVPKISKRQLEMALTEVQIFHSICYKFIDDKDELGQMVFHFTKAIAQVPYKYIQ